MFPRQTSRFRPSLIESMEPRTLLSTYIVTTLGDGAGAVKKILPGLYLATTLRGAINAANVGTDADKIFISPLLKGTIYPLQPDAGELLITNDVTIQGFGAHRQAVDGGGARRVFHIVEGAKVSINHLKISNGDSPFTGGGGVRNLGNLSLDGVSVADNTGGVDGAGVFNTGALKVSDSTFTNNKAASAGGGLFNSPTGNAVVVNSTFHGNSAEFGGGLYNADGGQLTVLNSTISGNRAERNGGGVSGTIDDQINTPPGTLFHNTIIAGNTVPIIIVDPNGDVSRQGPDLYGFFSAASSNNLIGNIGFAKGLDFSKNLVGGFEYVEPIIDPKLAPLGYYGGTTQTMPLLSGSPALNKGSNALIPSGVRHDQRGQRRIIDRVVDIGATEGVWRGPVVASPSPFASTELWLKALL